jgi:NADH-quinone oxidoreductase subunit C
MIAQRAAEKLKERFPDAVQEVSEFRDQVIILIDRSVIRDVCEFLRDDEELKFDMAIDVVGADRLVPGDKPRMIGYVNDPYDRQLRSKTEQVHPDERFEVIYVLYSNMNKEYIRLKVRVAESGQTVPSVVSVWKSTDWAEREVYDMFGIEFEGHPDLRRIYMPDYFEHYPLRKDFPLMGIPGSLPLPDKQ